MGDGVRGSVGSAVGSGVGDWGAGVTATSSVGSGVATTGASVSGASGSVGSSVWGAAVSGSSAAVGCGVVSSSWTRFVARKKGAKPADSVACSARVSVRVRVRASVLLKSATHPLAVDHKNTCPFFVVRV